MPIVSEKIDGREMFTVDDDALIACLAELVSPDVVRTIAEQISTNFHPRTRSCEHSDE